MIQNLPFQLEMMKASLVASERVSIWNEGIMKRQKLVEHTSLLGSTVGLFEGKKLGSYVGNCDGWGGREYNQSKQWVINIANDSYQYVYEYSNTHLIAWQQWRL